LPKSSRAPPIVSPICRARIFKSSFAALHWRAQEYRWRPREPATEDALDSKAAEMKIGRSELIQIVLREWLETNAYLPVREIDEGSVPDGERIKRRSKFRDHAITTP